MGILKYFVILLGIHISKSKIHHINVEYNDLEWKPECPSLSENLGRCGPSWGGRCNKNLADYAVYCNEENGWCGVTSAHKYAQSSDLYDWEPESCRKTPTSITTSPLTSRSPSTDVCVENTSWKAANGYRCADYATNRWCENGGKGRAWQERWNWSTDSNGLDARSVCCICGANKRSDIADTDIRFKWSSLDKGDRIMIEEPSRLSYVGSNKVHNLIRTTKPIPQKNWTSFYFEAKIVKGGSNDFIAIGLTEADPNTRTNCMPGWDTDYRGSYSYSTLGIGYHGDDGGIFKGMGRSRFNIIESFTTGDVVGCLVHLNGMNGTQQKLTVEFTKNGKIAPIYPVQIKDAVWYPTIGIASIGAVVETNFGEHPFLYSDMNGPEDGSNDEENVTEIGCAPCSSLSGTNWRGTGNWAEWTTVVYDKSCSCDAGYKLRKFTSSYDVQNDSPFFCCPETGDDSCRTGLPDDWISNWGTVESKGCPSLSENVKQHFSFALLGTTEPTSLDVPQCTNTDNGALDNTDDSCIDWYNDNPEDCGEYDDDDFSAKDMCCACKTSEISTSAPSTTTQSTKPESTEQESNISCTSEHFDGYHDLVDDEGNIVDDFNGLSYGSEDKCKQYCFDNDDCKSFTYCRNGDTYNCHLKDKVLINKGENKMFSSHHPYCTSYTKTCEDTEAIPSSTSALILESEISDIGIKYGLVPLAQGHVIRGDKVILSSSESKVKEAFEKINFRWNDKMRNMLGKKFEVLEVLDNDIIAIPSPDGSQDGKYYFPKSVLQLTDYDFDAGYEFINSDYDEDYEYVNNNIDFHGNGIPDADYADDDNDGIPDILEPDDDNDGIPDDLDDDDGNDGIPEFTTKKVVIEKKIISSSVTSCNDQKIWCKHADCNLDNVKRSCQKTCGICN